MLKRNPVTALPMRQSPDVKGVTIDFGDAPAHGHWRAMSMTITYSSGRRIGWNRFQDFFDLTGKPGGPRGNHGDRRTDERIIHIKLNTWELTE